MIFGFFVWGGEVRNPIFMVHPPLLIRNFFAFFFSISIKRGFIMKNLVRGGNCLEFWKFYTGLGGKKNFPFLKTFFFTTFYYCELSLEKDKSLGGEFIFLNFFGGGGRTDC